MKKVASFEEGAKEDLWVNSACYMCYSPCGIKVHKVNGIVAKIEGNPDFPHNMGKLCAKGNAGIIGLYDPYRIKKPMKRTNPDKGIGVDPKWVEISWEEAMDTIVERLKKIREDDPRKLVVLSFDVASMQYAAIWAGAFGTPNAVWTSHYFCGSARHLLTYLTNSSFHCHVDLEYCNYLILIGGGHGFMTGLNPVLSAKKMADARMRGMKLVVVDPVCSIAGAKANEWIPIRPGTDGALALAMLNVLLNELKIYDADFIKIKTNGPYLVGEDGYYIREKDTKKPLIWDSYDNRPKPYDAEIKEAAIEGTYRIGGTKCNPAFALLKDHVRQYTPEEVSTITTVPSETIRRIAKEFGEAARIGSKIVIDGVELPFRPAAVHPYRGAYGHKNGGHTAMAIQLLNLIMGAIHVPGSHQGANPIGPFSAWEPKEGPDGLVVAHEAVKLPPGIYDFLEKEPTVPQSAKLNELFPAAWSYNTTIHLALLDPEKFGLPKPEMMIHCRTNLMMSGVDPKSTEKVLKSIPFIVSLALEMDETVDFADILLPELHYLERFDPAPNEAFVTINSESKQWYWGIRQPVLEPLTEGRHWMDVLMEVAERLGFLGDFNKRFGSFLQMKPPYALDPTKIYRREEIADLWLKSMFGDSKGLSEIKEAGFVKWGRKVKEIYPLPFIKHRIPIYYEHFLRAGEYARKVMEKLGLSLDRWDYRAMPDWRNTIDSSNTAPDYDLYAITFAFPFHSFSFTTENPWLNEIAEEHPYAYKILLNAATASKKGIKDGEKIVVESTNGQKVTGQVRVSQCIHPEVIGIGGIFGSWSKGKPIARGKGVHFNKLIPLDMDRIDPISRAAENCVKVKIFKEPRH